jgi:argininosuccinate synthase
VKPRVVLAYSGGLDTSVSIGWLAEHGYDVVAATIDVGQPGDLARTSRRARELGAVEARLIDAKTTFVSQFVLPALRMNALYQGRYPLASALSRPLIARILTEIASETKATAVAHGCTGKGNDQVRFEVSLGTLDPDLEVLAPVRDWGMNRDETIAYAEARGLHIETTRASPYSIDENLWGRSIECGVLEDPWTAPPADVFTLTASPHDAQGSARDVVVGFDGGTPVSLDGETLSTPGVIDALGKIAGSFGYGRADIIEDRLVGIKSREVYEAPAAFGLITAHRDLESLVLERLCAREKRRLEDVWANLVYEGLWFSPLRRAIDAFAASTQSNVTGEVRLRFEPGTCRVVGRRSPVALYDLALATYDEGDAFHHGDAVGFMHLWGLPSKQWAKVERRHG